MKIGISFLVAITLALSPAVLPGSPNNSHKLLNAANSAIGTQFILSSPSVVSLK